MSFVDAHYDRDSNKINIVERVNGERIYQEHPANYTFYFKDRKGKHHTVFGDAVSKYTTNSFKAFSKEKNMFSPGDLFESDIHPIQRCLEDNYKGMDAPKLQTAFFDIEVDFDNVKGFSPTTDPFNRVTAISVYLDWLDELITLVLPPKGYDVDEAQRIADTFENTMLYTTEKKMLEDFLDIIDDADILSGWNSEGYDIPYMVNRITRVVSKEATRKFCLWSKFPKKRTFERFGAEQTTYDLIGRIHLDYMQLYRTYTYHEMHSYSLNAIAEYELGDKKVDYEGSLDDLYNKDFAKFIEYNKQDTLLLHKLDVKLKFISLANEVAHANTVLLPKTMGAVAVTEQAIINDAHDQHLVVQNKVRHGDDTQAAGAYVAYPKKGLHKWVGSVDINSLYPSAIQALNMAPETIIGQLRPVDTDKYIANHMADKLVKTKTGQTRTKKGSTFAKAWEGLFGSLEYTAVMERRTDFMITVDWEHLGNSSSKVTTYATLNDNEITMPANEVYDFIFHKDHNWGMSANGTIFTYEKEGVIPGLLARWYKERKEMQAKLKEAYAAKDPDAIEFWDKRQLVKKINLNSLYGAILNPHCRFYDKRIGQSTTLTGRAIAQHMDANVNESLTGVYDHVGECIIYGDTDSAYFSAWPVIEESVESGEQEWDVETAIQLYDSLADEANISFPPYMKRAFNCPTHKGELIRCGREVVGSTGLFITKKRYAIMVVDVEGERKDVDGSPGKVKAMGLDLKRSDTPVFVQDFLKELLNDTLVGAEKQTIIDKVIDFKSDFRKMDPWDVGSPKRINKLTSYTKLEKTANMTNTKARLPGHVRAGLNFNNLRIMNSDNRTMSLIDGAKAIICQLKDNPLGITSIARPTDEHNIPQWFKDLPFDVATMQHTLIDKKVDNLLGVMDWNLGAHTDTTSTFAKLFEF